MSRSNPPEGWYQDTRSPDRQRWWDGTQWTIHGRPLPSTPPPPHAAKPPPHDRRSFLRDAAREQNTKGGILIGGASFLLTGLIGMALINANQPDDERTIAAFLTDESQQTPSTTTTVTIQDTTISTATESTTAANSAAAVDPATEAEPTAAATDSATAADSTVAVDSATAAGSAAAPPPTAPATTAPPETVEATTTAAPTTTVAPQSSCDPNYSGCVPIASDVDCKGGTGNGPAYAEGPVQVIGTDIYDLDRDNDGIGCE